MPLSSEDSLRLNVLLTQNLQALRIDESKMIVYGLSEKGEAKIQLNPNCRDDRYLKIIKELISSKVLGSPGGYPVFLRRWTRMGQAKDESLGRLLQLGEPEAVVAVVHASGLTDELARRAWWAMPSAANARCMLQKKAVVEGQMGTELADFLIEFLPFEEEARDIIESVRLVLQDDLISTERRQNLWDRGQRKNAFLVGFLFVEADKLPLEKQAHPALNDYQEKLSSLINKGNPIAQQLQRLLEAPGQAFLSTVNTVIKKPGNQDIVIALLNAINDYFSEIQFMPGKEENIQAIIDSTTHFIDDNNNEPLTEILNTMPDSRNMLQALLVLSAISEQVVNPVFSRSDAIGTLMRKKLEPVFGPLNEQIKQLTVTV
ncbi:hypothetical protein MNBD_GAMMA25-1881 [hydrothermal vent metagenome]|uniref:DsrS n=1 Tax=hydrothermal vent metagenome TaxID=652676 RepID=A0A3B1AKH5_9ZZZZ